MKVDKNNCNQKLTDNKCRIFTPPLSCSDNLGKSLDFIDCEKNFQHNANKHCQNSNADCIN